MINKFKEFFIKDNLINIAVLLLYAVITLIMVFHHEIWRDEAQAWLVVRDLDLINMIRHVRTEGHPLLWYFVILPLTKIFQGFYAVFSMQILNWFLVVLGMGIFIFKSPFNSFIKYSFLFSSGMLYWYPVMARSYCLIPILTFLLAMLYPKQKEHPYYYALVLIALANTHVIMFSFCCVLALLFTIESWKSKNKHSYVATSLVIASLVGIIAYLWGAQNENQVVKLAIPTLDLESLIDTTINISSVININVAWGYAFVFLCAFCGFCATIFFKIDKKAFSIFLSNIVFHCIIFYFIWNIILPQRVYTIFLVILFCFWILWDKCEKFNKILVSAFFVTITLLSVPDAIFHYKSDYLKEYSNAKTTAKFIKNNIPPDAFIVANHAQTTTAISAYLPKDKWRFFYVPLNNYYTFYDWTIKENTKTTPKPIPIMDLLYKHKDIYILSSGFVVYEDLKPIYEHANNVMVAWESFRIYYLGLRQQ